MRSSFNLGKGAFKIVRNIKGFAPRERDPKDFLLAVLLCS